MKRPQKCMQVIAFLMSIMLLFTCITIPTAAQEDELSDNASDSTLTETSASDDADDPQQEDEQTTTVDGLTEEQRSSYEADGTLEERMLFMEEVYSTNEKYLSSYQIEDAPDSINVSDMVNIISQGNPANMPSKGNASVLVFLVDFPDMPHDASETVETARDAFFGEDSLASFYRRSSYEKLAISGDVQDWYTAQNNRSYYVEHGISALYEEVLSYYDNSIDYSQYDADGSGYIDGVYLHFSGENSGWGSVFWSYVTSVPSMKYDGISIGDRVCLLHTLDVTTIRHETGHLLGLQDYYSYTIKSCFGNYSWVGSGDMMVAGVGEHNAVSKMILGWIEQTQLINQDGESYTLHNITDCPESAIVYPFGETSGDSFFVLQRNTDFSTGKECLQMFRVNGKTETSKDGNKYYRYSNMYGEIPFIELIDSLDPGETVDPYGKEKTTHYYNNISNVNVFSGITVSVTENLESEDSSVFSVSFEQAPSRLGTPKVTTTAGINQVIVSIDYDVPFMIDSGKTPYIAEKDGTKIAEFTVKPIMYEDSYTIDRALCNARVASYKEWGYVDGEEIITGGTQDYILKPGTEYQIVIPAGAFYTVLGSSEELTYTFVADSTAVRDSKYYEIASFDRCSDYITLSDSRAAYAYVKLEGNSGSGTGPLMLALVSEDGSVEERTIIESGMLGYVSLCQLSDGTMAIGCCYRNSENQDIRKYIKYDLAENKVEKIFEPDSENGGSGEVFTAVEGGFFQWDYSGISNRKIRYINNDFTEKKNILTDREAGYTSDVYSYKGIIGDCILVAGSTLSLYDKEENLLASRPCQELYQKNVIGCAEDDMGNIVAVYCDKEDNSLGIIVFDKNLKTIKKTTPEFSAQKYADFQYSKGMKRVGDGYLLQYTYVRNYAHGALVGMFNTESYQQGILLDENLNVKCVFDVSYRPSGAAVGTDGRCILGDEYGFYTAQVQLSAVPVSVTLSSDKYTVDNANHTITGVPEGTTAEELLKFLQTDAEDTTYSLYYTHAILEDEVPMTQELSCNYQLIVSPDGKNGIIYTFPELPRDKDSDYLVTMGGNMYGYIGTDTDLITPDFVKTISISDEYKYCLKNVESLVTAASGVRNGGGFNDNYGMDTLKSLKRIEFLDGAEYIETGFLSCCPVLEEVILSNTMTKISSSAFCYSWKIKQIVIPASVTRIMGSAFSSLTKSELKVRYLGTREQWNQINFKYFHDAVSSDLIYDWEADIGECMEYAGAGIALPTVPLLNISDVFYSNGQVCILVEKDLFENYGYRDPYLQVYFDANKMALINTYTEDGNYYVFCYNVESGQMKKAMNMTLCAYYRGELCHANYNYTVGLTTIKFSGASLTLQDNLTVNYRVAKSLFTDNGYENPYVVFNFNGMETKVTDYTVTDDSYVFDFSDIAPHQMNDTIYATLYASFNGTEYASNTREYSVAAYCYNMLSRCSAEEYAKLRTLLVDLLNYGTQSQVYVNYRTDSLVNASLTEEQRNWGTGELRALETVQNQAYETIDNPSVIWKGAGLNLLDSVAIRFIISTDSTEGLSVKVRSESGKEWTIGSDALKETTGGYYFLFDELNAGQMSEPVYVTVYKENTPVSNTVCYSIESYAYAKQNNADTSLSDLVKAMMKYGDSAYSYIH